MKWFIYMCLTFCVPMSLFGTTYTVKQDGTGDFTIIQEAIDVSIHEDTIIVHPGRYFENIIFNGKNIYLTNLYSLTGEREYIENTIIDENQTGSGVRFINNETRQATIDGFTITNGNGTIIDDLSGILRGGGIYIASASPTIKNCITEDNKSYNMDGAGIEVYGYPNPAHPLLSGNIIRNNVAGGDGGGIYATSNTNITFDPVNKNSIYNNLAVWGQDIFFSSPQGTHLDIVLDVFTNIESHENFIDSSNTYTFSAESSYFELINSDLYVSPNGDDVNNDGLSDASPFKTVSYATRRIASDPVNPKSIFVGPGYYSITANEQYFPAVLKGYTSVVGSGPEETIFDSEGKNGAIAAPRSSNHLKVKGISFINTGYMPIHRNNLAPISICNMDGFEAENCVFRDGYGGIETTTYHSGSWDDNMYSTAKYKNLTFENNRYVPFYVSAQTQTFENIIIKNHIPYVLPLGPLFSYPVPYPMIMNRHEEYHPTTTTIISNMLIVDNEVFHEWDEGPFGWPNQIFSVLSLAGDYLVNNVTIVGNFAGTNSPHNFVGYPIQFGGPFETTKKIYNSIIYNNTPENALYCAPLAVWPFNFGEFQLHINNTLLPGGVSAIRPLESDAFIEPCLGIHWGMGNIDDYNANPLFLDEQLFQLSADSPCIDAGTLDIDWPGYVMPETDVYGNPRVSGNTVDIGAVEYQGDTADFIATPLTGEAPLTVSFTDLSMGEATSWAWDFDVDAGESVDSTEQNPTHTYNEQGSYTIKLTVNNQLNRLKRNYVVVGPSADSDETLLPYANRLHGAFPNPFNPETTISYSLQRDCEVTLDIYNVKGQKIRTLVKGVRSAGVHKVVWNGCDDDGRSVGSGVYFCRLQSEGFVSVKKMVMVK